MTKVYKEYAQALFMLSMETDNTDKIKADLDFIEEAFKSNLELMDLLTSPAVFLSERIKVIDDIFMGKVTEYVLSFLKLLCEKKHLESLYECIDEYRILFEESKNIAKAKIISAVKLSDDEKERIILKIEKTEGKKIKAEYVVDKSIIGGIIVETDGKILDGSLRYKLKDIKDVIK